MMFILVKKIIENKSVNQIFMLALLFFSAYLAANSNKLYNIFPIVTVGILIFSCHKFSTLQTKFSILLFGLHLLINTMNYVRINYNDDANRLVFYFYALFILYFVLLTTLVRTKNNTSLIKMIFYVLIAFFTTVIYFNVGPFNLGIDCIEQPTYEKFQGCSKATSQFNLFKANIINALVICISIFESISNGFDFFSKQTKSKSQVSDHKLSD
ncbi:hypothetical protein [Paenibacillus qinlingensis]|uniref:Transmembrane protein n=1 Tax=Paenibacillus qinlingensis TaxID=1837343 RepID=A0ABU1NVG6_9BACL|nr:hypothetical protein [Paenibacillus qinlingensis]MDR6551435.1 hypothetical protein [Paenibacillus qinlingensis]